MKKLKKIVDNFGEKHFEIFILLNELIGSSNDINEYNINIEIVGGEFLTDNEVIG